MPKVNELPTEPVFYTAVAIYVSDLEGFKGPNIVKTFEKAYTVDDPRGPSFEEMVGETVEPRFHVRALPYKLAGLHLPSHPRLGGINKWSGIEGDEENRQWFTPLVP